MSASVPHSGSSAGLSEEEISQRETVLDWAGPAFSLEVRDEAARAYNDLIQGRKTEDLEFFLTELEFGTGGMRGIIGNGAGRMNAWTVGRVTLAFCRYLKKNHKKPGLAIAYDSRRRSLEFARITAGIAARQGLKVYLFDRVTPTPVLSFAIRELEATGGVVITASHNPPAYNGYKVYLDDGGQLTGSEQKKIEAEIAKIAWSDIEFLDHEDPLFKKQVKMVGDDIEKVYAKKFKGLPFVSSADNAAKKKIKIVYSPLHGTGGTWLPNLLGKFGFNVSLVPEQAEPDGEFPTVKLPNPEEREALRMAEELAVREDADLFLATDPDADRLGAGVKTGPGQYELLNGNQLGSIMCAYLCEKISKADSKKVRPDDYFVFKTIVTTDLQREIARKNGVEIREVLTGFKFIAEQMGLLEQGKKSAGYSKKDIYLFGGEESYGYLPVDFVRDKDALASALLLAELLAEVEDLVGYLNQVYLRYGLYLEDLKSVTLKGLAGKRKIQESIENLRKENLLGWQLGERKVSGVLDYREQTRDGKPAPDEFDGLPTSNVLQVLLEPEGKLTIRPSGTEPKVKLYASLRSEDQPTSLEELSMARKGLEDELASISGLFMSRTGLA